MGIKIHTETILIDEPKQSKCAMDEIGITSMEFAEENSVTPEQEELQRKISDPQGYLEKVEKVRDTYTTDAVRNSSIRTPPPPRVNSQKDMTKGGACKKNGNCSIF